MTKEKVRELRKELDDLLKDFGDDHGLKLSIGNIQFDDTGFKTKLDVREGSSDEEVQRKEWEKYCILFGLNSNDFRKKVFFQGQEFELIGFNTRAHKFPIIGKEVSSGKTFKLPRTAVR